MNFIHFFIAQKAEILSLTMEHLWLVGTSIAIAVVIGVPVGIMVARQPKLRGPVLGIANVIQVIPSLALFGFLLPFPWLGERADRLAIVALALYALLPVIRNTYAGITGIDPAVREAARGMGMTGVEMLRLVELPLATGVILAPHSHGDDNYDEHGRHCGPIGAGGLGEFIFRVSPWWTIG